MINLMTYEGFSGADGQARVVGVYGRQDYKEFVLKCKEFECRWDLQNKIYWNSYIEYGRVFVILRLDSQNFVSILVQEVGRKKYKFGRDGNIALAANNLDHPVSVAVAGELLGETLPYLVWLAEHSMDPSFPVHLCGESLVQADKNGLATKSPIDLLFEFAHKLMAKGQTETELMAIIRRMAPERYDREFGDGGMAADMGDMGF